MVDYFVHPRWLCESRELVNFSSGAVCTVLASEPYDEADHNRDYDELAAAAAERRR